MDQTTRPVDLHSATRNCGQTSSLKLELQSRAHEKLFTDRSNHSQVNMAQRGESSSGSQRSGPHKRGPPGPKDAAKTVADLIVEMIDSQNTEVISCLSRAESCIRDIIAHMGTPSTIIPLVQFLSQLEGAKKFCLSDRSKSPHDFALESERPLMDVEHCTDPGFLRQQIAPVFLDRCRCFSNILDDLMVAVSGNESNPTFRFLWDVQITLSTIRMSLGN